MSKLISTEQVKVLISTLYTHASFLHPVLCNLDLRYVTKNWQIFACFGTCVVTVCKANLCSGNHLKHSLDITKNTTKPRKLLLYFENLTVQFYIHVEAVSMRLTHLLKKIYLPKYISGKAFLKKFRSPYKVGDRNYN